MTTKGIIFVIIAIGLTVLFNKLIKDGKINLKITKGGRIAVSIFATGVLFAIAQLIFGIFD